MKDQGKGNKVRAEKAFGFELTLDESLDKYKAPEYKPEKLKEIQKKNFGKRIIHQ
jgi:hypothetical protein